MKKKVYIISHSHWDREWYMGYEQHHMRLVELMDDLLELFKTDPNFNSFHLDGQTIILDDYLQVRPEKKAEVQAAITAGKLKIGPFYILQDDFLISSESNVRNMLIGAKESKKWGTPVALGYFPDTFGNMGQTPQLMEKANLKAAAFGRGVKPIGFDNEVLEDENYTSQYSEMWWEGPDHSKIFGLLFANWYSNGNEIPAEESAAKEFWDKKLADAEKYASTKHLLMMNGVDHQPVQKDLSQAIALANKLYPDYEFIHSNFTDYLEAVEADLPEDLGTVSGELTSQETDGWYTLANTASSRVYLKQWNTKVQRLLENVVEPLHTLNYELTGNYPSDELEYAWKTLLQNHPHDSICGCSVDEVHREMVTRFEKAYEVGKFLKDEALHSLQNFIDTTAFPEESWPFVAFNTTGQVKSGVAKIEVELKRKTFSEGYPPRLYKELEAEESQTYHVIDAKGNTVPATVSEEEVLFGYDLPKDRFRIPYMKKFVTVEIPVENLAAFSFASFALVIGDGENKTNSLLAENGQILENELVKVTIEKNGSLSYTDKTTGKVLSDLLVFEDCGDIANEYIFKRPQGDPGIFSNTVAGEVTVVTDTPYLGEVLLKQTLLIPKSADELLEKEQKMVLDFTSRKAQRSQELIPFVLETKISLQKNSKKVDFETKVDNQAKDHRLRVLFKTDFKVTTHEADSIYEVVTRPNKVAKTWKNPTNPQHQHAFCNLHDEKAGLTIGNFGLNEYEVVDGNTLAVTLLRCTGELGDWGYFPTPEAQCQGEFTFHYSMEVHAEPESRYATYLNAYTSQTDFVTLQVARNQTGKLVEKTPFVKVTGKTFAVTALKKADEKEELVLRGFNLADQEEIFEAAIGNKAPVELNLLEEKQADGVKDVLTPYEILTIGFK